MFATRASQQALRRLTAGQPSITQMGLTKFAPAAIAGASMQIRPVATHKMTPEDSLQILIAQRKLRPNSPHLTIYQPQIPWILSITHRITGSVLSGGFYIFGSLYLVAPLFGWHIDSASMAAAFGSWPVVAKVLTKFAVAMPFSFHSWNGIRHLFWDMTKGFANQSVIRTGWFVVGLSIVSSFGLALIL
ncbi:succinate dehydrogenase cytochrome b subunit [Calycina marina]|uniref:Succinate dehydrogenase cytochrome b subunit n=1 Tax=Calycina marina TaxID=1763456 RepID=A0A9P8CFS1_9HELO|nr:succinate dehydrogenase cytochrome b subunit [Calycina marina]